MGESRRRSVTAGHAWLAETPVKGGVVLRPWRRSSITTPRYSGGLIKKRGTLLLVSWAILSVGALAQFIHDTAGVADGELEVRLIWELYLLNAPISSLAAFVAPRGVLAQWCFLTFAGFVQWGLVLPACSRWIRDVWARRSKTRDVDS